MAQVISWEKTKIPVANNLLYLKAIGTLRREYERGFRARCNVATGVKEELVPMHLSAEYSRYPQAKSLCTRVVLCHGAKRIIKPKNEMP
jgi:hypothetical protein